jgi:kinetochore protein Mis13/DSN1
LHLASPHQSIPSGNFYTLIDAELSDPLRMKQLLTWCGSKSMEEFPVEKGSSVDAVGMNQSELTESTSHPFFIYI